MACKSCGLPTKDDLCEACQSIEDSAPEHPSICLNCNAPLAAPALQDGLCRVCAAMSQIIRGNRWLLRAHFEWERENSKLAELKKELMGH